MEFPEHIKWLFIAKSQFLEKAIMEKMQDPEYAAKFEEWCKTPMGMMFAGEPK